MNKLILVFSMLVVSGCARSGGGTQWEYSGLGGPEHWGNLSPEFDACSSGKNQSPIDLTGFIEADLEPIGIHYQVLGVRLSTTDIPSR